ncbi:amidase [Opitutaceae bacterium]
MPVQRQPQRFALLSTVPSVSAVTLTDWHALSRRDPAAAARLVRSGLDRLLPEQRRAIIAWEVTESELARALAVAPAGALAGVPYLLKDLFHVGGVPTQAGGTFLPDVMPRPRTDGRMVQSLRATGAALAGKTHLHEFAYGLTGENPHSGDVDHPAHPGRTSGGSSSGSAAAVAAGIVPFAIGTDTGGSVRVPAAFCGLYGLRLSPHEAWIADAFPLAPSFDTAGWFTASPADMLTVTSALIGVRTAEREPRGCSLDFAALGQTAEPAVTAAFTRAAACLAPPANATVAADIRASLTGAADAYAVLQSTEAYAVHAAWLDERKNDYEPGVWQRIDRGRRWTATQVESAQFRHAMIKLMWTRFFLTFDFLILPATPFPALRKADCTLENRNRLLALTAPASLGGLPVLTVPVYLPDGLSSGLQIIVNDPLSPVIPWALARCSSC